MHENWLVVRNSEEIFWHNSIQCHSLDEQGGLFLGHFYAESVTLWSPNLMPSFLLDFPPSTSPRINSPVLCTPHTCQTEAQGY